MNRIRFFRGNNGPNPNKNDSWEKPDPFFLKIGYGSNQNILQVWSDLLLFLEYISGMKKILIQSYGSRLKLTGPASNHRTRPTKWIGSDFLREKKPEKIRKKPTLERNRIRALKKSGLDLTKVSGSATLPWSIAVLGIHIRYEDNCQVC